MDFFISLEDEYFIAALFFFISLDDGYFIGAGFFYFIGKWVLHWRMHISLEGGYFIRGWVFNWGLDSFISLENWYQLVSH